MTHKWISIEKLELSAAKEARSLLKMLSSFDAIDECAVLKTCNRIEIYAATEDVPKATASLESFITASIDNGHGLPVNFMSSVDSLSHLMRVSSGLDSMVVGEQQVATQLMEAYELALSEGTIDDYLGECFRKAINVGKKVRTETNIDKGHVSIGSVAVELAEEILGTLTNKNIMVLGAGEISQLVAKSMHSQDLNVIFVANRSYKAAVKLAGEFKGSAKAVRFEELDECLRKCDAVICGTAAPHIILEKADLMRAMGDREKPLLIIDLSNPRNISEDVADLSWVILRNLDGLKEISEKNTESRRDEILKAERIIEAELELLKNRISEYKDAKEVISRLYCYVKGICHTEYAKSMNKLPDLSEEEREVILNLVNSLAGKILAHPAMHLKNASKNGDRELITHAEKLFDLEQE